VCSLFTTITEVRDLLSWLRRFRRINIKVNLLSWLRRFWYDIEQFWVITTVYRISIIPPEVVIVIHFVGFRRKSNTLGRINEHIWILNIKASRRKRKRWTFENDFRRYLDPRYSFDPGRYPRVFDHAENESDIEISFLKQSEWVLYRFYVQNVTHC